MDLQHRDDLYIFHDGQQYGPLSFAQVVQFYQKNPSTPSDLYWYEGLSNWLPLPELLVRPTMEFPMRKAPTLNDTLNVGNGVEVVSTAENNAFVENSTTALPFQEMQMETVRVQDLDAVAIPNMQDMSARVEAHKTQLAAQNAIIESPVAIQETADTRVVEETPSNKPQVNPAADYALLGKNGLGGFMLPVILASLLFFAATIYAFYQFVVVLTQTISANQAAEVPKSNLSLLTLFAAFGSFAACAWTLALNVNLLRKRRVFPSMFRATIGITALFSIILLAIAFVDKIGWIKGLPNFQEQFKWLPQTLNVWGTPLEMPLAILLGSLSLLIFWMYLVMYVSRSTRVRNTFIY